MKNQAEMNNKSVKHTKLVQNRQEFPYGSIVSINGHDLDEYHWTNHNEAPIFLWIVQNPGHHDGKEAKSIDETSASCVTFVTSGYHEWLDSDMLNTLSGVFNDATLNFIAFPPANNKEMRYHGAKDLMRRFENSDGKWTLRNHQNPCFEYGSPWCNYEKHKKWYTML